MSDVSALMVGDRPSPTYLGGVVQLAQRLVRGRRASLMLPAADADEIQVVAATGSSLAAVDARVRLGDPISGIVAQRRQPMLVNAFPTGRAMERYETGAFISVPILLDADHTGVLNVADPQGGQFGTDDLDALEIYASQLGQSIERMLTHHQIEALEETIRELRRRNIQVLEDERQRLARELHDEAGHTLTAAILRLDLAATRLPNATAPTEGIFAEIRASLQNCAATLHTLAFALRPRILQDFGLHAALKSLAAQYAHDGTMEVAVQISGEPVDLSEDLELAIFRVAQEALTNVRKHARAMLTVVTLEFRPDGISLAVDDNGIGFDPAALIWRIERPSLGISGMRERVEIYGGRFSLGPRVGGGTSLRIDFPFVAR